MSLKENDVIINELQEQLVVAIEQGNKDQEAMIRQELNDCGLVSKESLELLEETL